MTTTRDARGWHLLTAVVCAASLALNFYLSEANKNTVRSPFATSMRIANFFSFFTIQSNLIVLLVTLSLVLAADRDGPFWRIVRLTALVCITVTCLVDLAVLRPTQELKGLSNIADLGVHVVTPILVVLGWFMFGPRPRFQWRTLWWSTVFPLAWLAYTLIRGPRVKWYPYPFIDVIAHGYLHVMRNVVMVAVLFLALGALFVWLDRILPATLTREESPTLILRR